VWAGLCFGVPFADPSQGSARDLVANAAPDTVSGLAWTRDNRGNTAAVLDATSYVGYPDNPAHNRPSTAITVYVRLRHHGTGADVFGGVVAKRYSTGSPWTSWSIFNQDGLDGSMAGSLTVSGTLQPWDSNYVLPTTSYVSVFLRWRTGDAPSLSILGERGQSLAEGVFGGTLSGSLSYTAGEPIRVNATDATGDNFDADYSQVMVWDRRLTDVEVQALVADPFGWYSPRRQTLAVSGSYLFTAQTVVNGPAVAVPAM
jgi:hypothetical protein